MREFEQSINFATHPLDQFPGYSQGKGTLKLNSSAYKKHKY